MTYPSDPVDSVGPNESADLSEPVGPAVAPARRDRRHRYRGRAGKPAEIDRSLTPLERVIPSWTDPTARRASVLLGGPLGRHAIVGRNRFATPLRILLAVGIVMLIFGWMAKSPCIQTGADGGLDQSGERPWITGCYNDIVPLYGARGLDDPGTNPYAYVWTEEDGAVRRLEYPTLTGYFMWGMAAVTKQYLNIADGTGILPKPLDVGAYFTITAMGLGLMYLLSIAATAAIARRRVWDTMLMCASPLLIVHAFTNWDALAIGLTAAGMWAWARRRPGLAGILVGLGAAAKLYPLLLLGPLLVLCWRSGKMRAWWTALIWAVVAWAASNLPIALAYPSAWREFFTMNSTRGPEWDSWYFLSTVIAPIQGWWTNDAGQATPLLNYLSLGLFALACVAIGWFALSAQRRPRFAQLAFIVIAAFLLTNKVWSPQYSLWLLPLVVLALPQWRKVMLWQLSEVAVWYLLMQSFSGDESKALPINAFAFIAVIRGALVIWIVVTIIRQAQRPETDPVRIAGDDDPSGGVLERAPDRFTIPSLPALWQRRRNNDADLLL